VGEGHVEHGDYGRQSNPGHRIVLYWTSSVSDPQAQREVGPEEFIDALAWVWANAMANYGTQ
jgi:hypothetical protein